MTSKQRKAAKHPGGRPAKSGHGPGRIFAVRIGPVEGEMLDLLILASSVNPAEFKREVVRQGIRALARMYRKQTGGKT